MRTVSDDLDLIQSHLHDNGELWPRSELLRWYNDAYVRMLADSQAVRRIFIADVPGRVGWAFSQEWEDRHCPGLHRRFTRPFVTHACSFTWEVETVGDLETVNASGDTVTQLWERAYSDDIDAHFRFSLSRQHDRIVRVQWDDKALHGVSESELDLQQQKWWQEDGEPLYWLSGIGRDHSVELFAIETTYGQQYEQKGSQGLPRHFAGSRTYSMATAVTRNAYAYTSSGDSGMLAGLGWRVSLLGTLSTDAVGLWSWERDTIDGATTLADGESIGTYWWETEFEALGGPSAHVSAVGVARRILSNSRQYAPQAYADGVVQFLGAPRDYKSTVGSLAMVQAIVPTRQLKEAEAAALVPPGLRKYLRYFVLSRALGRKGEGQQKTIGSHYEKRFERGVGFFKKLSNIVFADRNYGRQDVGGQGMRRLPHPHLPAEFERVW
jgi:hypothetical protein